MFYETHSRHNEPWILYPGNPHNMDNIKDTSIYLIKSLLATLLQSTSLLSQLLLLPHKLVSWTLGPPTTTDDVPSFTFSRSEVIISVLINQWRQLIGANNNEESCSRARLSPQWISSFAGDRTNEGIIKRDQQGNLFSVLKCCSRWNRRRNESLRFRKTWFTNGIPRSIYYTRYIW